MHDQRLVNRANTVKISLLKLEILPVASYNEMLTVLEDNAVNPDFVATACP